MKKNIQTRLNRGELPEKRGNCFPAVISCIMELDSADDVIQIQKYYYNSNWKKILLKWLNKRGYDWIVINEHQFDNSLYLVTGISPRDNKIKHVCVYKNGKLYHDPHPDNTGILSEEEFEIIKKS